MRKPESVEARHRFSAILPRLSHHLLREPLINMLPTIPAATASLPQWQCPSIPLSTPCRQSVVAGYRLANSPAPSPVIGRCTVLLQHSCLVCSFPKPNNTDIPSSVP